MAAERSFPRALTHTELKQIKLPLNQVPLPEDSHYSGTAHMNTRIRFSQGIQMALLSPGLIGTFLAHGFMFLLRQRFP
jgi:hypothetical protein